MSKKVTKSEKLYFAVIKLLDKAHNRSIWLSNTLRDLKLQFDTFRDETRLKVGSLGEAIGDLRQNADNARLVQGAVAMDLKNLFDGRQGFETAVNSTISRLKAEIDRAWALNESRNQVFRKFEEDVNRTLQFFNERISKAESDLYFAKTANVDNARVVNSHGDRLKVVEGQTGMLSEVAVNNNGRLQTLEEKAESTSGLANAAWQHMVGVEKRVSRLDERVDYPSAIDQDIVDSKLSGLYYRIAALEKRIREASVAAPATSQLWTTGNTSDPRVKL